VTRTFSLLVLPWCGLAFASLPRDPLTIPGEPLAVSGATPVHATNLTEKWSTQKVVNP
jgi:hypothetical protein